LLKDWGGPGWFAGFFGNIRAAYLGKLPPVFSFAPLWSLQVEEQYYLLFPAIVAILSRGSLRRFLIGCVIAAPLLRTALTIFVPNNGVTCYVLMPCRMDALALGGLVALMMRSGDVPSRTVLAWVTIMGSVAATIILAAGHPSMIQSLGLSIIDVTCAALLALVACSPDARPVSLLRWAPLVYIGQISYGLYLLHGPAAWIGRTIISRFITPVEAHSTLSVVITFIAGIAAASLSWRFELKILELKERFTGSTDRSVAKLTPAVQA
jgi:peptidoglycan/LPS O-acetylase OafA/YrhL